MRSKVLMMLVVGLLFVCIGGTQALTMDWVTVGNAGNAADDTGYGSVGYGYQIGKYEVTAGQYAEFLNAVAADDTYGLYNALMWSDQFGCKIRQSGISGGYSYSVAADRTNRPVNFVGWYDSLRFANWLHNGQPTGGQTAATTEDGAYNMKWGLDKRNTGATVWLPSEDEWYKAAYHKNNGTMGDYFLCPNSSDSMSGRDVTEATNTGNNANYYDNGYLIGSPYYRTEVGEFELSDSPYGAFDMGGNVWEWNEVPIGDSARGIRGGSYVYSGLAYNGLKSSERGFSTSNNEGSSVGFRVATVPEPATLLLVGLGAVMLRRKKG